MTECAPNPSVISLILATPSSPRSVTISVAPKSRASFCRAGGRLIANNAFRAHLFRCQHRTKTDRPIPYDGDGLSGCDRCGIRSEPAGAQDVRGSEETRDFSLDWTALRRDEGTVRQRNAQVGCLGAACTDILNMRAAALVAGMADHAGIVQREERPDHELSALDGFDSCADFLDDPAILVSHGSRPIGRIDPSIGPKIRSAHATRGELQDDIG